MFKKLMTMIFFVAISNMAIAETCPSVAEIKNNMFHGWNAYTDDNGEPLYPEDLERFKKEVYQFSSIRWINEAPEGESHCYYVNGDGSYALAFLARPNLVPDFSSKNWRYVDHEPTCDTSIEGCVFLLRET